MPQDWETEYLDWKERQLLLREKYPGTPAGFQSEDEKEAAWAKLKKEWEEYRVRRRHVLEESYRPAEEIFVGRETYLEEIHRRFAAGKSPVILYGIGGIGKTSIARAYVRAHQDEYDAVLFLSCGPDLESLICDDGFLKISNLRYSADKYGNRKQYYKEKIQIFTELAAKIRLLLVLDDCNLPGDARLNQILDLPCSLLVTTRLDPELWGRADAGLRILELQTVEEWRKFRLAYSARDFSADELQSLLSYRKRVKGHTLLMMMRIHRENADLPPDLEAERKERLQEIFQDLFARFSLSRGETQMLRELSVMPVQGISEKLYLEITRAGERTVRRLEDYLLLRREERDGQRTLSLHPLIAEAARGQFTPNAANCKRLVEGMYRLLHGIDAWNRPHEQNQPLEACVLAIVRAFPQPEGWQVHAFEKMATFLWIQGYFDEAERLMLTLVKAAAKYYGKKHQTVGEMYLRLAAVYHNELDDARANPCYWRGYNLLSRCRKSDRRYEYLRKTAAEKVARLCYEQGKYRKALRFLDEAQSFVEVMKKRDSGVTAMQDEAAFHYLQLQRAQILISMGKLDEAEFLTKQGRDFFAAWDREHGEGCRAAEFEQRLARIAMLGGDYEKAERICRRILEQMTVHWGEKYKETLYCREMLADCLAALGEKEQAREEYEQVLLILLQEYPGQEMWIRKLLEKQGGG